MLSLPDKQAFKIGQVAQLIGVPAHVLRFWEQEFPQLKPEKNKGNQRIYQRNDVILLHEIKQLLYDRGFTISGARKHLRQTSHKSISARQPAQDQQNPLQQIRTQLEDLITFLDTTT